MSKYYIEVDAKGVQATGYEDRLPWVSYGTIVSEGDTLEELLDNATVDLIDQDGEEAAIVGADKQWMLDLVEMEYIKQLTRL